MAEQIKLDVAGVVVAPLALADLILTEQEKLKGCALIDFGAGVTSVTMYKDGSLAGLYVIPLGSHLITRDLMSLGMPGNVSSAPTATLSGKKITNSRWSR